MTKIKGQKYFVFPQFSLRAEKSHLTCQRTCHSFPQQGVGGQNQNVDNSTFIFLFLNLSLKECQHYCITVYDTYVYKAVLTREGQLCLGCCRHKYQCRRDVKSSLMWRCCYCVTTVTVLLESCDVKQCCNRAGTGNIGQ